MLEPMPCGFCKETPNVASYRRDTKTMRPDAKPTYQVKCVSRGCAHRTVETHRFTTKELAIEAWNGDRG